MKKIYLHVGLQKTGSTYLQTSYFPKLKDIAYIGKPFKRRNFFYSVARSQEKNILISDEGMAYSPIDAYFNNSFINEQFSQGIKRIAELFPNAYPIIGFRKHDSLLLSLYKHYIRRGGTKKLNKFFNFTDNAIICKLDLDYSNFLLSLKSSFNQKPFIFFLEELKTQNGREILSNDLCKFLNVKTINIETNINRGKNTGLGESGILFQKMSNRLTNFAPGKVKSIFREISYKSCLKIDKVFGKKLIFDTNFKNELEKCYKSDWKHVVSQANELRNRTLNLD